MRPTVVDPSGYVAAVEHPTRRQDAQTLMTLMSEVSGEEPVMWGPSIIGFGENHYVYDSGREGDQPKIAFSPRKANLVLYVLTAAPETEDLLARLGKHKRGKGCLYINKLADVDLEVLQQLMSAAYEYMVSVEKGAQDRSRANQAAKG